jgi:CHAT domain-containing protein
MDSKIIVGLRSYLVIVMVALVVAVGSAWSPARAQTIDIQASWNRYQQLDARGDNAAALAELQKLAPAVRASKGPEDKFYAGVLHEMAQQYFSLRRFAEAEDSDRRALPIAEKVLGPEAHDVGAILKSLSLSIYFEGRYRESEELCKRGLAIFERIAASGGGESDLPSALNQLAEIYQDEGRYAEAEVFLKRSLAVFERVLGAGVNRDADYAGGLLNLGHLYVDEGRYAEAETIYIRSQSIYERNGDDIQAGKVLTNRANSLRDQKRFTEAEATYKRSIAKLQSAFRNGDPLTTVTMSSLAVLYQAQGRFSEAERILKQNVDVLQKFLGTDHPDVALSLILLANVLRDEKKYPEAEATYVRALAALQRANGPTHPDVAKTLYNMALMYRSSGQQSKSREASRQATAAVISHAATQLPGTGSPKEAGLVEQRADYFRLHLANLADAARKDPASAPVLGREALEMAQWAAQSSAAAALQQMSARLVPDSSTFAALVRENQDLDATLRNRNQTLVAALSRVQNQQSQASTDALRGEIAGIEEKMGANRASLEKALPEYAALTSPKPLGVEEIQKLLGPEEALVFIFAGDEESHLFALTQTGFDWRLIPLPGAALTQKVAAFRRGLDLDALRKSLQSDNPQLFDLGLSNDLYATLLGPVEPLVKGKKQLLIVPTGALTALPFHLLVTEKPTSQPSINGLAAYRDAAWLIRRHAVTILPSVASLKALRAFGQKAPAAKPMIGFGDPSFNSDPEHQIAPPGRAQTTSRALSTGSYTDFWQGAGIDRAKLSQVLPRLADTAVELKTVAKALGAPESDIHLGTDASETTVKRAPLSDYRVVYFATHGLVAGDIKGLAEPSLALSIPSQPSELDDGLLTASEVAELKLNADWVVLSACNTIAGDKPGAEALSGLARAFFYAGARSLLVSHWGVDSLAVTRLTTSTFEILKSDPKLGRAEALRRAMLAYLGDSSNPENAYPAWWGPFAIIGDGAAR